LLIPTIHSDLWEDFAAGVRSIIQAIICAAILSAQRTGYKRVFLTLLGGGAFGNEIQWITDSIQRLEAL
jgi:hypothetical protein